MINLILPILLKVLDLILDKVRADKEAKEGFLRMVIALSNAGLVSVRLNQSYEEQNQRLKELRDKLR